MSREERAGWRDEAYSAWHRGLPYDLDFLDIDWIEYCHVCKRRLCVYELCADINNVGKVAYITKGVADDLRLPGFIVLYEVLNGRVARFRIRRITEPVTDWKFVTPEDWIRQLLALRTCHPLVGDSPVPRFMAWCREHQPDGTGVCTKPKAHAGPHVGPDYVWPQAVAS